MSLLLATDEQVRQLISPAECLAAVEEGFRLYARHSISDTQCRMAWQSGTSSVHLYAAQVPGYGLGAKVLSAFEQNPEQGEPYIYATIIVLDPATGRPRAVLEGGYLTALRTAAATALGACYLCRPDSRVLGILGSGLQSRTHLLCHLGSWPYERVVVWGRNPTRVKGFVEEMQRQVNCPLVPAATAEKVCEEADVITCTTRSDVPLFPAEAVRPGTHIGIAGPMRPGRSEIPLALLPSGELFVDAREKFQSLWQPESAPFIKAELGSVIVGAATGRTAKEQITLFKPVGMAFEDVMSARIVLDRLQSSEYRSASG